METVEKIMKGSTKEKGMYANSLSEGKVKELTMDMRIRKDSFV